MLVTNFSVKIQLFIKFYLTYNAAECPISLILLALMLRKKLFTNTSNIQHIDYFQYFALTISQVTKIQSTREEQTETNNIRRCSTSYYFISCHLTQVAAIFCSAIHDCITSTQLFYILVSKGCIFSLTNCYNVIPVTVVEKKIIHGPSLTLYCYIQTIKMSHLWLIPRLKVPL